ncbi:MAG: response regulator [Chloroflexi bacterium]|nr:response regulator [Chloroflexota bacterium]
MSMVPRNGPLPGDPPAAQRVLIITNRLYQARLLEQCLGDMGSEVTLAADTETGLAYLGLMAYDTVVIDVDMGYPVVGELAARLRLHYPTSELAIMTGWWDARAADMRSYSDRFIYKPVHPQQLREALARRAA